MLMSYANEPYFRKSPRIDEQFGVGQQFSIKPELKVKIADFHVQRPYLRPVLTIDAGFLSGRYAGKLLLVL
jgi:hypothetical protein